MANQAQQMPIIMNVGSIAALTEQEAEQIKKYIELETIFDVQFKDADKEVMIPVGFTPEVVGDDSTTPATVTVIKDGTITQVSVTPIVYDFTSYGEEGTVKLADGKVIITGNIEEMGEKDYKEVKVIENDFEWAVGHLYLVAADAKADGETKYPIYEVDGTDTGMQVTISPDTD